MAPHSSTLAWKIPWTEEPGRLQSMGSLRVGHDWATSLSCIREGNGNPLQCSCLQNPRDEEPGGLLSMGSHRVGHDWSNNLAAAVYIKRNQTSSHRSCCWDASQMLLDYQQKHHPNTVGEASKNIFVWLKQQVDIPNYSTSTKFLNLARVSSLNSFLYPLKTLPLE